MDDSSFFIEIQELLNQIEDLVDNYDYRDRYISVVLCGLIESGSEESDLLKIKSLYNYNIENEEELEDVQAFINLTYNENNEDEDENLEDFLGELGIELE
tara:strand:+ start:3592 stop:3891 length:300 start_codon:yes stop_codon:yes gene_type:complete